MLNLINWDKPLTVNGVEYANSKTAYKALKGVSGNITIAINVHTVTTPTNMPEKGVAQQPDGTVFKIGVRQYMARNWEFNDNKNNGVAMPMRVMVGTILQETKGMYKMELHGQPMPSSTCLKCGKALSHPVSLLYGIGPECGKHYHINPFNTEEELMANYEQLRENMSGVTWVGWVIKTAIEIKEVL